MAAACAALFPASRSEETASAVRRRGWCAPPRRRVLAKEEDEAPAGSGGALSPPDLAATGARNLEMEAICVAYWRIEILGTDLFTVHDLNHTMRVVFRSPSLETVLVVGNDFKYLFFD